MPSDDEELSDLIGRIYDCALDPTSYADVLARMALLFHASAASIIHQSAGGFSIEHSWGWAEHRKQEYVAKYAAMDPLLPAIWRLDVGEVACLSDLMDPRAFRRTRFYREFWAPQGWQDIIGMAVEKSSTRHTALAMIRDARAGKASDDQCVVMRRLASHIRRASQILSVIQRQGSRASDLAVAFDLLKTPLLLFDANGRCLERNIAATKLLAETRILPMDDDGAIRIAGSGVRQELADTIIACTNIPSLSGRGNAILLEEDGRRFACHVLPLSRAALERLVANIHAVAAVFIEEVGALQPMPGDLLVKLYGFTPAETRLVGLLGQGQSIEEAASALGIALTTARTHLRHIFDKTGTRRQAELTRLVLSALPLSATEEE